MGSALRDMLPYAIGLLVSPLPIVAVIVLIGGSEGTRKGIVFCVTWWLVSFVVVLALALFAGAASRPPPGPAPAWEGTIKIILGLVLLIWAVRHFIEMRRGPRYTLRELKSVGDLTPDRIAVTAVRLLADPLRLSMLIAAALELGSHRLSALEDIVPAGVFALVGTLTVILPLLTRLSARWLLRHNDLLVFLTSLAFGAALLINGLRQLQ